jgi:glutathione S-transferase
MLRLITISISHYVEKVKWALEHAGLVYKEESYIPGLHAAVTLWHTKGRHRATPVLIDGGDVIPDSTAILQHLAARYGQTWLYAHADALPLEERFDANIGPHTRRFIYRQLFDNDLSLSEIFTQNVVPEWQTRALPLMAPALKAGMIAEMAINHAEAERSRKVFETEFDFVGKLLQDGRRFLCGDALTAADLTFAALAAPVVLPAEYGARLPDLNAVKAGSTLPAIVETYRKTPAGEYVLRLYREQRQQHREIS